MKTNEIVKTFYDEEPDEREIQENPYILNNGSSVGLNSFVDPR